MTTSQRYVHAARWFRGGDTNRAGHRSNPIRPHVRLTAILCVSSSHVNAPMQRTARLVPHSTLYSPTARICSAGLTYKPLSSLSFMTPTLMEATTVPWSNDLRKNGEDQVLCLPFAHTPFHLSEAMRSLSTADATVADVLRFEPSSVKETMVSAMLQTFDLWAHE